MKNKYENILAMYYLESRPTLKIIGAHFGISKQRIEQIVIKYGKGKRANKPKKIKLTRIERRLQKFFSLCKQNKNGCIEWCGCHYPTGYGHFRFSGEFYTHRVAWVIQNGDIPAGMYVLHKCDNRICVNTDHLYIGTQAENVRDREERWAGVKPADRKTTKVPFGKRNKEQTG